MMIRKLQEHFPARTPEWFNAVTMFCWGFYILLHPGIFAPENYRGFVSMAGGNTAYAERFWGSATVIVGFVRMSALFINGAYSRTPAIRLLASAASAFVWSQVVVGLLLLGRPSTGVVMYTSAVCLDLLSAYRAACDMVIAETTRRIERGLKKRGKSSNFTYG